MYSTNYTDYTDKKIPFTDWEGIIVSVMKQRCLNTPLIVLLFYYRKGLKPSFNLCRMKIFDPFYYSNSMVEVGLSVTS